MTTLHHLIRRPRCGGRVAAGVVAAVAAWALAAGPAAAQVDTSATDVADDGATTVVVTVASGCDGADTTELRLALPPGAAEATPLDADGGLTATVADDAITWSGGTLPAEAAGTVSFSVLLAQDAGAEVPLPVEQVCGATTVHWRATATEPSLPGDGPAPVLVVPEGGGAAAATTTTVDEDRPAAAAVAAAPDDESALGGGAVGFMVFAGVMVALAGGATYLVLRSRRA